MNVSANDIKITSFVVKIVSRCNINCDYCYVYKHVDQSYKKQPFRMSKAHITLFARRINEYLSHSGVDGMSICLHGGEPLLAGLNYLENLFITLHQNFDQKEKVRLAIQTNAVLLTKDFLNLFRKYNVGISLSLDGPRSVNDKHRLDHQGQSTYDKVIQAVQLLNTEYREIFLGIICVIDPTNDPKEIIDFFSSINPPSFDLLFPDANHLVPPPGRTENPTIYEEWIRQAIHYWHTNHPQLRLRMFKNVHDAVFGLPTESEFFGNGNIGYLILETDGSYHYSDLLKAAYEGASKTGLHVESASINDVIEAPAIQDFQSKLLIENKCESCIKCPELKICGSGQIAHRYGPKGFNHPTTYCREMLAMIRTSRHLIFKEKAAQIIANPECFRNEMMEILFSEHSIYLMGAITNQEVPSDIESGQTSFGVFLERNIFQEALQLIQNAFCNFTHEFQLVFTTKTLQELKNTAQNENDALCCAEIILDQFIKRKFHIFHGCFPLTEFKESLELVYRLAYSYRFWQNLTSRSENAYLKTLEIKKLLIAAIDSLNFASLSEMGRVFFDTLIDEFLQGQIAYKGNHYVYC